MLSTAVIGRSSSAPRLQTYKAEDEISFQGKTFLPILKILDIRRFWPPLRSLETMHDNIGLKELDNFLERMMKNNDELPSPPKTPIRSELLDSGKINIIKYFKKFRRFSI